MPMETQVQSLVDAYLKNCSEISGIKPAQENRIKDLDLLADKIAADRGRPLFFKYVGSFIR